MLRSRVASPRMPTAGTATGAGNGSITKCSRASSSDPITPSSGCMLRPVVTTDSKAVGSPGTGCTDGSTVILHDEPCIRYDNAALYPELAGCAIRGHKAAK
jgi:hypothetical protein